MVKFKWVRGRQSNCRYFKYCFLFKRIWKFGFDGYILAYPAGAELLPHKDPIKNGKHYRLNITLKGDAWFKIAILEKYPELLWHTKKRINLFRPDLHTHALSVFSRTYKLSLGLAIFSHKL